MNEPTAANPLTITLGWAPDQNHAQLCVMPRRAPIHSIIGLLNAGERYESVAAEFDLSVEQIHMIEILAEEAKGWA